MENSLLGKNVWLCSSLLRWSCSACDAVRMIRKSDITARRTRGQAKCPFVFGFFHSAYFQGSPTCSKCAHFIPSFLQYPCGLKSIHRIRPEDAGPQCSWRGQVKKFTSSHCSNSPFEDHWQQKCKILFSSF